MPAENRPLLDGIKVVELTTMVFGPAAGVVLSDFGADVIKVEPPGQGDLNRNWPQDCRLTHFRNALCVPDD